MLFRSDASPLAVEFSSRRGVPIQQGALPDGLNLAPNSFDAVLMLDVLEHLEDDVACARSAASVLKPGGLMLLTVPAYQWLYGPHDTAHHHHRRYTRRQVRDVLSQAGLNIRYTSYYNALLFPLALAAEGSCQIGGNLSTNAGGVQVLRYGNTRELALGLEVVLPSGEV